MLSKPSSLKSIPAKWCVACPSSKCQSVLPHSWQIIVHAPSSATDTLIESCNGIRSMTKDIFAPDVGETIQIGQQTNSFSINISDELLASLKISRVCTMPPSTENCTDGCFSSKITKLHMSEASLYHIPPLLFLHWSPFRHREGVQTLGITQYP